MAELRALEIKNFLAESTKNVVSNGSENVHGIINGGISLNSVEEWRSEENLMVGWKSLGVKNISQNNLLYATTTSYQSRLAVSDSQGYVYHIRHSDQSGLFGNVINTGRPIAPGSEDRIFFLIDYKNALYWLPDNSWETYLWAWRGSQYDLNWRRPTGADFHSLRGRPLVFGQYLYCPISYGRRIEVLNYVGLNANGEYIHERIGELVLPSNSYALALLNVNNRYIGIIAEEYPFTHVFYLWDGNVFSVGNMRIYVRGRVVDGVVFKNMVFLFIETHNGVELQLLRGDKFETIVAWEKGKIHSDKLDHWRVRTTHFSRTTVWNDFIILPVNNYLLFVNPITGNIFRRILPNNNNRYFCVIHNDLVNVVINNAGDIYYQSLYDLTENFQNITTSVVPSLALTSNDFYYATNWLRLGKRIRIIKMEVYLEDTYQQSQDLLKLSIKYVDEERKTSSQPSQKEYEILPHPIDNQRYKKEFGVNIECNLFKIELYIPENKTWRGYVRKVVVYYEILE